MLKFTEDHEWVLVDGDTATVGITDYAQKALGDIVFVEVPELDAEFSKGDDMAVVESVKAASDVYAPVSGTVTEVNESLEGEPALVNSDPMGDGWFAKMTVADADELESMMSEEAYNTYVAGLD